MSENGELPGKKPEFSNPGRQARRRLLRDPKPGKLPGKKPGKKKSEPNPPSPAEKE